MALNTQLYMTLLEKNKRKDAAQINQTMMSTIFSAAFAEKSDSLELLIALAAFPPLTPTQRTRISKVKEAGVFATFVARADVTDAERDKIIAREKRVSVLSSLAESASSTSDVLDALSRREGKSLAATLLGRNDLSETALFNAITTLAVSAESLSGNNTTILARAINRLPDARVNELALDDKYPLQFRINLARTKKLTAETKETLLEKFVFPAAELACTGITDGKSPYYVDWHGPINYAALLIDGTSKATAVKALELFRRLKTLASVPAYSIRDLDRALDRTLAETSLEDILASASTATDDALSRAVKYLGDLAYNNPLRFALGRELAANPLLDTNTFKVITSDFLNYAPARVIELVQYIPTERTKELFHNRNAVVLHEKVWDFFQNNAELKSVLEERIGTMDFGLIARLMDAKLITRLPEEFLAWPRLTGYMDMNMDRTCLSRVSDKVAEALGENAEAWDYFHTLAPGFPDTMEDLLSTCLVLGA